MKHRVLVILCVLLGAIILFSSIFYLRASRPMHQAEDEAFKLAEKYAEIERIDEFYWYNREKTYFTILGRNFAGEQLVVIIPDTGEKVVILNQKDGLSEAEAQKVAEKEAKNNQVVKMRLGLFEKNPVWEATVKNKDKTFSYYLVDFKTGQIVNTFLNI